MFAVHPGNRVRKLQVLSFEEAVSNLPKPTTNPKKPTNKKRAADTRPPPPAHTKKRNFSASATTASVVSKNKDSKPCSSSNLPNKTMPNNTTQTQIKDTTIKYTTMDEVESNKRAPCCCTETAVERYKVAQARQKREAARISLLKLEQAADGRDNHQLFKELEDLCGCPLAYEYECAPLSGALPYLECRFGLKLKPITKPSENLDHSLSHKGTDSSSCDDAYQLYDQEEAASALHYKKLMEWMSPSSPSHIDELDDDWLFKTKHPASKRQKKVSFLLA